MMMQQPMMVQQPMMMGTVPVALNCPAAFRLTCRAEKLEAKDGICIAGLGSTSDPYIIVRNMQNQICGKSAVVMKNLNPRWAPFEVDAFQCGGMMAPILVEVYDWDKDGSDDRIGEFRTSLQELTTRLNSGFEIINMKKRGRAFYKNSGRLYVLGAEAIAMASKNAKAVEFRFEGKGLDRKDLNGKSDPYFVIYGCPKVFHAFGGYWGSTMNAYKKVPKPGKKCKYSGIAGSPTLVYKSKPIMKTLNPTWEPFVLESRLVGGPNTPITIEVWDYDNSGEHDFIGSATTCLRDLMVEGAVLPLINKDKKDIPFYRNSGTFHVKGARPVAAPMANELAITHVKLLIAGHNLASRDLLSKSDPFITFKSHSGQLIYRSEEYMNQKNPEFKEIMLPVVNCGGLDGKIKVTYWDWDYKGSHDLIGETTITLRELSFFSHNPRWRLVCDKYKGMLGYKNSGFMVVKNLEFVQGTPINNVFVQGMAIQPIIAAGANQVGVIPNAQPMMAAQPMGTMGMQQPGMMMQSPGMMQPGMQPGMAMGGMGGMPMMQQPGMMQPGMGMGGMPMMQPGMMQPGMMMPGMTPQQQQMMMMQQQQQMMMMQNPGMMQQGMYVK